VRSDAVWVVIPTYNERDNIEALVAAVLVHGYRVLVVDDGSPDGTGRVVDEIAALEPLVTAHHRQLKQGLGPAYVAGFEIALHGGAEAIVEMDADFSHDPKDLPRFVDGLDRADVVLGSRYVPGGATPDWRLYRRLISRGGNAYARVMLGLPVRDSTGGFRAFRAEALRSLDFGTTQASGYGFQVEMAWRAVERGLVVTEIPIVFSDRRLGVSKMGTSIVFEAMALVTKWGFQRRLRWFS